MLYSLPGSECLCPNSELSTSSVQLEYTFTQIGSYFKLSRGWRFQRESEISRRQTLGMNTEPHSNAPEDADVVGFAELMTRASAGDLEAQLQICRQYEQQVRIVARVLLGTLLRPHLDTMDLMQSVHKSLLLGIRDQRFDISSPEKLVSLACTIVRRKVARKWRSHRRQVRLNNGDSASGDNDGGMMNLLYSLSGGHSAADQATLSESIQELCHNLSDVERIMVQRRLEGYTTNEVADELKLPPVTVRVRWMRLKQRLQAAGVLADWL